MEILMKQKNNDKSELKIGRKKINNNPCEERGALIMVGDIN